MQIQKPVLIQEQRLKMSPQLIQSIKMMTLPILDLKQRIQEELEINPALEIIEETPPPSVKEVNNELPSEYEYFENSSDPGFLPDNREDKKRQFIEGTVTRQESLQDHLLWQLRLIPLSEEEYEIGSRLIQNLNQDGFHQENPELLVPPEKKQILDKMIELLQTLDPVGTCSTDYREALLIQAKTDESAPPFTEELLKNHLILLEKGKLGAIAKDLGTQKEAVQLALDFIKTLTPFPGRPYSNPTPQYVIPDLSVFKKEGEFVLRVNDEEIPVLGINTFFDELLEDETSDRETKTFVTKKIRDAQWFLRSLNQRNDTLVRVAKTIIEFQRDFFRKGPRFLVPLVLKDIAEVLELHETTISRITTNKYIQTEWGIFELKYFFSNAVAGRNTNGNSHSKESVKFIIKEIIEENTAEKRLSDQKISDILQKKGIQIARRTVAKYRKELHIDPSFRR